jgi:hypothetical protein
MFGLTTGKSNVNVQNNPMPLLNLLVVENKTNNFPFAAS